VIYRRAVSWGKVAINPVVWLELPGVGDNRERIASPDEAQRLLAALAWPDRAVWATAIYCGLRAGELQALDWSNIDLAGGVIRVERAWDPKAKVYVDPKSRAGRREVPILGVLRDVLVELRMSGSGEGILFPGQRVDHFPLWNLQRRARQRGQAAGLDPIGLHECRHTFASLMIAADVNATALSTYTGHSNLGITYDRYGHPMPDNENEAAPRPCIPRARQHQGEVGGVGWLTVPKAVPNKRCHP
jgi:integrase